MHLFKERVMFTLHLKQNQKLKASVVYIYISLTDFGVNKDMKGLMGTRFIKTKNGLDE